MSRITAAEFEAIVREKVPLVGQLGVEVVDLGEGRAKLRLPFAEGLLRPGGTITGPAIMGLADVAMYAAVMTLIGPVELAVTTHLNAAFLRRPAPTSLVGEGRVLKLGRRLAFGEVSVFSEGDPEPVSHVTVTYSIPPEGAAGAAR